MSTRTVGVKYELCPCDWLSIFEIAEYYDEFKENREECNVLWQLEKMGAGEWKAGLINEHRTKYVAFLVDDYPVGIGRLTLQLNYEANGMFGYAIRPSERGNGYASVFIRLMSDLCKRRGIERVTACVDEKNEISLRAFRRERWKETGQRYNWFPNPDPRVAVELVPEWCKV